MGENGYSQHLTVIPKGRRLRWTIGHLGDGDRFRIIVTLLVVMIFVICNHHRNLRFGRDMLGFTLGLPVRPHAYLVTTSFNLIVIK